MMSIEQAAKLSGLSRQWWYDAESGERSGRPAVIRPASLAKAVLAVGGDLRSVFEVAGYDPRPFVDQADRWEAVRRAGGEIAPIPAAEDAVDQLAEIERRLSRLDELPTRAELQELLVELTGEVRALGESVGRLHGAALPDPQQRTPPTPGRGAPRATR